MPEEHAFTLEDNILTGNCFGCQATGDAISFVREVEHLDFVDAVERLASRAGITLRYDDKSITKDKGRKARLTEAVAAAIAFYEQLLLESPEGGTARRYLRGRGFNGGPHPAAHNTRVTAACPSAYAGKATEEIPQRLAAR